MFGPTIDSPTNNFTGALAFAVALLPTLYHCRHELVVPILPITPATWAPIQHCACLPDPISHTPETRLATSCLHQYRLLQPNLGMFPTVYALGSLHLPVGANHIRVHGAEISTHTRRSLPLVVYTLTLIICSHPCYAMITHHGLDAFSCLRSVIALRLVSGLCSLPCSGTRRTSVG